MRDTTYMGRALATAAAVAFSSPALADSFPIMNQGTPTELKCEGGNSCRGQSLCKSSGDSCQGQNACKGQGWVYVNGPTEGKAKEECHKKGGHVVFP